MAFKYEHDTLSYEEPILIGKKVVGKDEKGKDIIDAFYAEFKTRTRKAPARLSDDELNTLLGDLTERVGYLSIHETNLYRAILELITRRKGIFYYLLLKDIDLDILLDSYVYNYIDKLKAFGKPQTQRLSAVLELKERRILASIQ